MNARRSPILRFAMLCIAFLATHTSYASRLPHELTPGAPPCVVKLSAAKPELPKRLIARTIAQRTPKRATLTAGSGVYSPLLTFNPHRISGTSPSVEAGPQDGTRSYIAPQFRVYALRI